MGYYGAQNFEKILNIYVMTELNFSDVALYNFSVWKGYEIYHGDNDVF